MDGLNVELSTILKLAAALSAGTNFLLDGTPIIQFLGVFGASPTFTRCKHCAHVAIYKREER